MSRNRDDFGPVPRGRSSSANEASKPMLALQRRQTHTGQKPLNFSPSNASNDGKFLLLILDLSHCKTKKKKQIHSYHLFPWQRRAIKKKKKKKKNFYFIYKLIQVQKETFTTEKPSDIYDLEKKKKKLISKLYFTSTRFNCYHLNF